jgi:hypothetical protein
VDVCLLCLLYVVRYKSLRRADHSSRDSYRLWWVVVCDQETLWARRLHPVLGCRTREN